MSAAFEAPKGIECNEPFVPSVAATRRERTATATGTDDNAVAVHGKPQQRHMGERGSSTSEEEEKVRTL